MRTTPSTWTSRARTRWRHRQAGCGEVLITSGLRWALMHELRGDAEMTLPEALARLSPCDLALIEGYKAYPMPKLEDLARHPSASRCFIHRIPTSPPSPPTTRKRSPEAGFRPSRWATWTESQHLSTRTPPIGQARIDLAGGGE